MLLLASSLFPAGMGGDRMRGESYFAGKETEWRHESYFARKEYARTS